MLEVNSETIAAIASKLYNETSAQQCSGPGRVSNFTSDNAAAGINMPRQGVNAHSHPTSNFLGHPHQAATRHFELPHEQPSNVFPAASHSNAGNGNLHDANGSLERITKAFMNAAASRSNLQTPNPLNSTTTFPNPNGVNPPNFDHHPLVPDSRSSPFPSSSAIDPQNDIRAQTTIQPSSSSTSNGLKTFVKSARAGYRQPGSCLKFAEFADSDSPHFGYESAFRKLASPQGGGRSLDVHAVRRDFPILHQRVNGHPLVWFDNAATTQKPKSVIDAVSDFYSHDNSNIHRAAHSLAARSTDAFESARKKVQQFIGAGSPNEIVWVRGTTEGINFIAQTLGKHFLQPNDEIILSTLEHHANIVPWQLVCRETGAKIRVIPVNDSGEIMMSEYQSMLSPRTKIVSITHASNSLGTILPVAEMTQLAHRVGARVVIDGAQSVSHFPINVRELNCDFFVFSGHKIFAPMGVGVVYVRDDLLEILPPWQGGGNMIRNVTFEETTYADPPAKFEAGTPTVADAVGLGAAIDYLSRIGMENVSKHERDILNYATDRLRSINGIRMLGHAKEKVSVISFVLPNRRTEDVGKALDQYGIAVRAGHHCAQPSLRRFGVESTVRPSFSIYNTHEEVDLLVDALNKIASR